MVPSPDTPPIARDRPVETGTARTRRWLTFAQVSGGLGTVAGAGFGVGLGAGTRRGRWLAALAAAYWPPSTTTVASLSPSGARVDLVAGDASTCLAVVRARALDLGPCVAFEMGRMHASSVRVSSTSDGASVWAAALAGAFASVGLGPAFGLTLHVDALAPVVSPRFQIGGSTAYQPTQVEGRATLCGEVRF